MSITKIVNKSFASNIAVKRLNKVKKNERQSERKKGRKKEGKKERQTEIDK